MPLPRLFIRAALPMASIFLVLAGILQLRAPLRGVGAIFIILAMIVLIFSIRLLDKKPFTAEEMKPCGR